MYDDLEHLAYLIRVQRQIASYRRVANEAPDQAMASAALYMTVLILSTQRRDDELASHREQLTLELAILGDQKAAKIIELLEELRRDHPEIDDRIDHDARAMSTPADPQAVFEAIKDSHEETLKQR